MLSYFLSSLLKCYSRRSWLTGVYLKCQLPDMVQCSKTGWRLGYHLRVGCLAATCKAHFFFVCGGWYFHQCFKFCAIYPLPPKICSSHSEWGISMIKQIWMRCKVNRICSVSCSRWFWIYRYFSISPLRIITVISDEEFEAPRGYLVSVKWDVWASCRPLASLFCARLHPSVSQTFVIGSFSKKHTLQETRCRYTPSRRFPKALIFTTCDWLWSFAFYSILVHFVRHKTPNWFTDPQIGLNHWLEKHWFSCLDFSGCANN